MLNSFKNAGHLRNDSSNGSTVRSYIKPVRTTGEKLGSLVGASLNTVDDFIYVFGGFDQYSDDLFNKLYKLDYKNQCHWSQVIYTKGKPPGKRTDHSATLWQNNKLVIFGGSSEEEEDVYFNDISVLDLNTMTWQQPETSGHIPQGRIRHSATIYNNKLYIAGGIVHFESADESADTLLVLDLDAWVWLTPIPFVRRSQHMSFVYNHRLYLFSGLREDMSRSNDFAIIDLQSKEVSQLEIVSPSAPSLSGQRFAQVCGDQLIVLVTYPFREALDESPVTGLWSLHLSSMQWKYREIGTRYEGCNWHSFTMAENSTCFYLCGTTEQEPDEFYSMVLRVEIEELGIVVVPPSQLGNDMIRLLQSSQHTDFMIKSTVEPDATPIAVHQLVLLARWPHFLQKYASNTESNPHILHLPDPTHILAGFVRFLYADNIDDPFFTTDLVADLLVLAQKYVLPRLTALCVRRLYNEMNIENASKIYHHATIAEQRGLKQASLIYIFQHFGAISHTQGFRRLPRPILFQIWDDMPNNATIVGQDASINNALDCNTTDSIIMDEEME